MLNFVKIILKNIVKMFQCSSRHNLLLVLNCFIVLAIIVPSTQAQAYLFSWDYLTQPAHLKNNDISSRINNNINNGNNNNNNNGNNNIVNQSETEYYENLDNLNNNTNIIFVEKSYVEKKEQLSDTAMDVITIIWYVATFLALAVFFMLMACSDRRCRNANPASSIASGGTTEVIPPPTPSPSYSEFAPPSYETVIKMQHDAKTSIFVIPFSTVNMPPENKDDTDGSSAQQLPLPPNTLNVYTVNEQHKTGH